MAFFHLHKKETDVEQYKKELETRRAQQEVAVPSEEALLTVQDVFTITGRGTVVTGQCQQAFAVGDQVFLVRPDGSRLETQVCGLESFHKQLDRAQPGDHIGVLLRGLQKRDACKGCWLERR